MVVSPAGRLLPGDAGGGVGACLQATGIVGMIGMGVCPRSILTEGAAEQTSGTSVYKQSYWEQAWELF